MLTTKLATLLPALALASLVGLPAAFGQGEIVVWGQGWEYTPVSQPPAGSDFVSVDSGGYHVIARRVDGSLVSWGTDSYGVVSQTPTGTGFRAASAGTWHSVAIRSDGSLVAWGMKIGNQVSNMPAGTDFVAVSAGHSHNLALRSDGSLASWGYDGGGQVSNTPTGNGFVAVSAGFKNSMAIRADGSLVSWGDDALGQVSETPIGTGFVDVSTGYNDGLAIRADGSLVSWGSGYFGLGNVPTGNDFVAVSSFYYESIALRSDGSVVAWGWDDTGKISAPRPTGIIALGGGGWGHFSAIRSATVARAGADVAVNEGEWVTLDGTASSTPAGSSPTYAWQQLPGGTPVMLIGAGTAQPSFVAPPVPLGGETLTFRLTVAAGSQSSTDTVSVTVVNVNHPPVADAGDDRSVVEGALVTLDGADSFDVDNDLFSYAWTQIGGPAVELAAAATANPSFNAPFAGYGGAPGVVATLEFELRVADGFPFDQPAPGYTFDNVVDSVTVEVTNTNNAPTAVAGEDQTVDESSFVLLGDAGSSDPDGDPIAYSWIQIAGLPVELAGADTATPSFTTPFVSAGGGDLAFRLIVDDGFGGIATDDVVVHVQNANDPPLVSAARPTVGTLWPPTHDFMLVGIVGVSDPDNNATITITAVTQDEPTNGQGDGDTPIDAIINPDGTVYLRGERSGVGDGRVYHIHFIASDLEGSVAGVVTVAIPRTKKEAAIDGGELYDSTL